MKIYTAKGDKGKTSLLFGGIVSKDDLRIECLGELDELNSLLGLAKTGIKSGSIQDVINSVQRDIYIVSSEIATKKENLHRLKIKLKKDRLLCMESQINKLASQLKIKRSCFFIPGENYSAAILDVCRAVCRRVERRAVALKKKSLIKNDFIIAYLNRLSSLLFVLARLSGKRRLKIISL